MLSLSFQERINDLLWERFLDMIQTFMVHRGCILMTLLPWLFTWHHQHVNVFIYTQIFKSPRQFVLLILVIVLQSCDWQFELNILTTWHYSSSSNVRIQFVFVCKRKPEDLWLLVRSDLKTWPRPSPDAHFVNVLSTKQLIKEIIVLIINEHYRLKIHIHFVT